MKKSIALMLVIISTLSLVSCKPKTDDEVGKNNLIEPIVVRMVMKDVSPKDPIAQKYIGLIEKGLAQEGTKVQIKLEEMPSGNYAEKLNLKLLGKDIPDIIYFQGGDQQISQQGLLEDLTPYIKKSKYIKPNLEPQNKKRLANYPYLLWIKPLASKVPVMRSDWFNKLSTSKKLMEDPTIDNYYAFLKQLKDSNLGGKGSPAYALTAAGNTLEIDEIFDQAFGNKSTWIKDKNGKYIFNKVSKSEKEKLTFYNKLYKEGILDPEFLTKKWDTKEKAFYENGAAIIAGTAGKVIDIYEGKIKKANGNATGLTVLPPAKGKAQGYLPIDVSKENRGIAISSTSKNKDISFKILDFLASEKGQMIDRLGFEGEHYVIKDNKIQLTEKSQEWYAKFWEPSKISLGKELAKPLLGAAGTKSLEDVNKLYTEDINFIIPEELSVKWDSINNLYKEYSADIITGKRPISDFDKFVTQWYENGGEDITKHANEVLK
ncbi:extracellular solute-binding protein [Clostridium tagluense]|uniref:extracellular solute-binding protein n=1 Tax=Clostridium tagluense TaxID=360422 RepID=UPI001CF308EB|nr:extracellular solute-binding protein [Clostridium tagluense]MCB2312364.1 extracellular solute-binding protein [Clostridium tagluense]MCB2317039.1 extracellular solute-binding protein [Clostridium tagluense]MCB2321934.1 extracellular solute-binding protein [Clostridium tagluense]MCB2326849.1 extracellular solute-binding protein [Clostridium tagluense]MCB2331661.1 extracellular solute-binding protein [Clostridium tagluense]